MQLSNTPPGEVVANTTPASISAALRKAEQQVVPDDVVNKVNWVRKQDYISHQDEFRERYRDPERREQMKNFLLRPDVRPRGEAQYELLQCDVQLGNPRKVAQGSTLQLSFKLTKYDISQN